jgi:hypothetical protein
MRKRTKLAAGAGAALAAAGAGGAVAATQLSPSEESAAIVEDAAARLGVEPERLSDALRQAFENRIDRAVEDGTLPAEAAERLKERLEAGDVPLVGGALLRPGGKGHGPGHRAGLALRFRLDAAADYLGLTAAELRERLRAGTSLAEVARDEGKSVDGLVDALVAEQTERLDEAVEDGRLGDARRDELVAGLRERVERMVEAEPLRGRHGPGPRIGPGFGPHEHGEERGNDA